jgi:hypothetical protein
MADFFSSKFQLNLLELEASIKVLLKMVKVLVFGMMV